MRDEDLDKPPPKIAPLDNLSIEDLQARIAALSAEIQQCQRLIEAKTRQRAAADALFRGEAS